MEYGTPLNPNFPGARKVVARRHSTAHGAPPALGRAAFTIVLAAGESPIVGRTGRACRGRPRNCRRSPAIHCLLRPDDCEGHAS